MLEKEIKEDHKNDPKFKWPLAVQKIHWWHSWALWMAPLRMLSILCLLLTVNLIHQGHSSRSG
jgi:4-hydroxybenzoate polyprenyltransferase